MKDEININKELLFFRFSKGYATPEEKAQVEKIIKEFPEISEELSMVRLLLDAEAKIKEIESQNVAEGFEKVGKKINLLTRKKKIIYNLLRVAAILTLPLLISTLTLLYVLSGKQQKVDTLYAEVFSAPGTVTLFELPDKSKVWLNSKSTLRYPINLNDISIREVELEGEGYFEVKSDKKRPFYVTTAEGLKVIAYGTEFSVNSEDIMIETVLAEGKIAVFYQDKVFAELIPGEQASFNRETQEIEIQKIHLAEKIAWKDGKIIFRNAPLTEVFEQLSKRYNVDILLHDDYNQSGEYLSRVTFTDESIQQILSYLAIAAPIEWKVSKPKQNSDLTLTKQRIDVWLKKKP